MISRADIARPDPIEAYVAAGDERLQRSGVSVAYEAAGARTFAARVAEHGSLRLRHPRATGCLAVLINTGGGIVAGDRLSVDVTVGPRASVTVTTAAAEKVYRSDGPPSVVETSLALAAQSRAVWVPQDTILFDKARLTRRFEIDVAESATFVAAELVIFGRITHGERSISGSFRDSWRLRRGGRLVYADETAVEGEIGARLDRNIVARGARAMAVIVLASPDTPKVFEQILATVSKASDTLGVEGGASHRDGIVLARFVGPSPEDLRATLTAALAALDSPPT